MLDGQGEGPFYLFFQANYDQYTEGLLSIAIHEYDKESMVFREVAVQLVQN